MTKQEKIALELTKAIIIANPDIFDGENLDNNKVNSLIERSTEILSLMNDIVDQKFEDN